MTLRLHWIGFVGCSLYRYKYTSPFTAVTPSITNPRELNVAMAALKQMINLNLFQSNNVIS